MITQALNLYLEGTSFRAIGWLLGLSHQTKSNWVMEAATAVPAQITDTIPRETIELDERYSITKHRQLCPGW